MIEISLLSVMVWNLTLHSSASHISQFCDFFQKLIRMNMPVAEDNTVHFTTTLFALIRESLQIKMGPAEEMNRKDDELKDVSKRLWPIQTKKMIHLLMPPDEGNFIGSPAGCLCNNVLSVVVSMFCNC
jgi:hypothetical protein